MPFAITVTPVEADAKALREVIERLAKVGRKPRRLLGRIGLFIRREARRLLRARPDEWGPSSGRLSASLAMRLTEISVTIGSNLIYAAIQQLGGEVEPKGHRYLAIPVARAVRRNGTWPRDFPKGQLKFVPNAEIRIGQHRWFGPALVQTSYKMVSRKQKDGTTANETAIDRSEVIFALVEHVTIKGRVYLQFSPEARAFALGEAEREYRQAIAKRP